jgi:glutamine cyclotransferase
MKRLSYGLLLLGSYERYSLDNVEFTQTCGRLGKRQSQEENGKTELEEIREDNIQAAKKQKSRTVNKEEKNRA